MYCKLELWNLVWNITPEQTSVQQSVMSCILESVLKGGNVDKELNVVLSWRTC